MVTIPSPEKQSRVTRPIESTPATAIPFFFIINTMCGRVKVGVFRLGRGSDIYIYI